MKLADKYKIKSDIIIITDKETNKEGTLCELIIDWEERKIYTVLPFLIHNEGFTYEELGKRVISGKATLLSFDDDMDCFSKNGWTDEIEIYTQDMEGKADERIRNIKLKDILK